MEMAKAETNSWISLATASFCETSCRHDFVFPLPAELLIIHLPTALELQLSVCGVASFGQIVAKKKRAQSDRQSHSRQLAKRFPFPFGFWSQPTSSTFFGRQVCAFHLHRLARLKRKTSDTNPECYIWWQVATWRRHQKLRCALSIHRLWVN